MEVSTATNESSLISKLQFSDDLSSTHQLFSSYLHPFSAVLNKPVKSSKVDPQTSTLLRSLAKKFLHFLNKTLSLLPQRLSQTPNIDSRYATELFETYKLCLSCLESVSSQLSGKPYFVQIQRIRLMHCYENWGRYEDAQTEGLLVLDCMRSLIGEKGGKLKGRIVPELRREDDDKDVALLIVEVVLTIVKCVSYGRSKDEKDYRRVLSIVDEIKPWFRIIDANAYEKLHRALVTYLNKCTLFLVGELASFDVSLAHDFCLVTFSEFAKSSVKDQMNKFGRRICSSVFSQLDSRSQCSLYILTCVFDAMAHECKIGKEKAIVEFLELAAYCSIKCRTATVDFCSAVATHFDKLAGDFSQVNLSPADLIMRLYAITLSISDLNHNSRGGNSTVRKSGKEISVLRVLLNKEDRLQSLTTTLGLLTCHYEVCSFSAEFKNLVPQRALMGFHRETCVATHNGWTYMPFYFSALQFLCEPLSELINSSRKEILAEFEDVTFPIKLLHIQDALHLFSLAFLTYHVSERYNSICVENNRTVLTVAAAAFTLSLGTKQNIKESSNFLRHLISADWIQANGLKFLFASLHNVGIDLYRSNRLKEATKSLKVCCKAAWECVLHICKTFVAKKDGVSGDISEDTIAGFVTEACAKSAFLLDLLYQCGSQKVDRTITDCLESWCVAQSLFSNIPSPIALVQQWVRIKCKILKEVEVKEKTPTLHSLMSSSSKISKETLGILLEQELQAYKDMKSLNPGLCKQMQMTVTSILLEEIYITKDSCLQKSKILVAKGKETRVCGIEGLNDCIKYFSEAISTMNDFYNKSKGSCIQVRHQLAEAYCLRALVTQEAEPNSKHFCQDISNALRLWLSLEHSQSADHTNMVSQSTFILLYHVADLLSIKGYIKDHSDIYEMMIRFFTWNNVPLGKCVAMLWQSRSLNHSLCASPVNDVFVMTLSKHCDSSKSMQFWLSCLERSQTLKVGFQQSLSAIFTLSSLGSHNHDHATQLHATVDEVVLAASNIITSVPLSSSSVFLASQLYYDLGERLIARGLMIKALSYAKEAHRLRSKLLQKNFMYSIEQQNDTIDANGEVIQKRGYNIKTFHMHPSVATSTFSYGKDPIDFEDCILTPWSVLRCYLESTLQMGTIHEIVGNGSEAETLLLWGKNISSFQGLSIFLVSFSSTLGKLYRKQHLWHLAEKELESAKHILSDDCSLLSCSKCRLVLEVTVEQELGDLFRSRLNSKTGNELYKGLSKAESFYRSATEKLNLSEWKNCVSNSKEASGIQTMFCDAILKVVNGGVTSSSHCAANQAEQNFPSKTNGQETIKPKTTRKNRKSAKPLLKEQETTTRVTRSRYQSSKKGSEVAQKEVENGVSKHLGEKQIYTCPDALIKNSPRVNINYVAADGFEVISNCDKINCWHCLPFEIMKSLSLESFIQLKWECIRRRLLLKLLIGIGKCFGVRGEIHRTHEVLLESLSVLVSRSTFQTTYLSFSFSFLVELIQENVIGDCFAVEHASVLYNLCWFSLKSFCAKGTRNNCCDLSSIPMTMVVSWLKLSFILSREVPVLFQKVSRLLAVLYSLSSSNKAFSMLSSSSKALSESQWASYFHQASLGTHLNHQLFSRIGKEKAQNTMDGDGPCLPSTTPLTLLRLEPESIHDLEGFVLKFFQGLPCATIVCISMIGDSFASLLRELLLYDPPVHAWIMLSRLNSDGLPVVVLLPVDLILQEGSEDEEDSTSSLSFGRKGSLKPWHCPWGYTVIDEVAPLFKFILEENYISSSTYPLEDDTKRNRSLWWTQRRKLDQCLGDFLRDMEDLWLGPWKYLLLGEWSDCKHLDFVQKKLMGDLKSEYKVDVHESILKVIIGGAEHDCQQEECLSELILNKGCYVGGKKCHNKQSPGAYGTQEETDSLSSSVYKLILDAVHNLGVEEIANREPVILVLDFDVQMLPWENLPILRNQEVYRMPSIASISSTFHRCCQKDSAVFPVIDPLDAYYLLNPGGDLSSTEAEFGSWFKNQNLEGKTGASPSVDELSVALKNHDLFIYFGHGSGVQYIPGDEIKKLNKCAATLLMGCSSGSLFLNGSYTPKGAPLYYLFAGSPIIVANLWEVTDKDIDRFGKAMLDAWITERSTATIDCDQCNEIAEKLKNMNIDGDKRKGKKKISKKKFSEASAVNTCTFCCKHRPKIGSFMGRAREACTLPFLIGASPVCYGVPTGIRKKDL